MVWVRYNETLANNTEGSTADIPASTAAWLAQRGFVSYCEPVSAEPTEDLPGDAALDAPKKPILMSADELNEAGANTLAGRTKGPGRGNYPRKPRKAV